MRIVRGEVCAVRFGVRTDFEYDQFGRPEATLLYNKVYAYPSGYSYVFSASSWVEYGDWGRVSRTVDFAGRRQSFEYDFLGRTAWKYYGEIGAGTKIHYNYDSKGYLTD